MVLLPMRIVVPQFCSASVMPAPARRIVECVKPAGRLLTSALIPCCHQLPDTGAAAAIKSLLILSAMWYANIEPQENPVT